MGNETRIGQNDRFAPCGDRPGQFLQKALPNPPLAQSMTRMDFFVACHAPAFHRHARAQDMPLLIRRYIRPVRHDQQGACSAQPVFRQAFRKSPLVWREWPHSPANDSCA
jgi:hypothetical protein